jgi:sec-independent protein translocase protein TatB
MFDLGWSELLLIAGVALIVIGPKDLPQAIRAVTQIIRKMRGMAREFQSSLDDLAREAGVDEVKRDLNSFKEDYDPRAALDSIAGKDDDTFGDPEKGHRIEPPNLTPADFGASDTAAAGASPETPADPAAAVAAPDAAAPASPDSAGPDAATPPAGEPDGDKPEFVKPDWRKHGKTS